MSAHFSFDIEPSWQTILKDELSAPYFSELVAFLEKERAETVPIYPPQSLVFNAFAKTPFNKVRVVILGQDPYHNPGQAHGLSFSVPHGVPAPPSLQNIFKELHSDLGLPIPSHGCLDAWAEQGVFLLNATLTVSQNAPLSHHNRGWELLTDAVIKKLIESNRPLVFLLWGNSAQKKWKHFKDNNPQHLVLLAPHPSPLSAYRGFLGCGHFSKTNGFLIKHGMKPIDWKI
jgi:uracil-DNA glycosylase